MEKYNDWRDPFFDYRNRDREKSTQFLEPGKMGETDLEGFKRIVGDFIEKFQNGDRSARLSSYESDSRKLVILAALQLVLSEGWGELREKLK